MSVDDVVSDSDRKKNRYQFDRHSAEYRSQFKAITEEMQAKCPMAWSDTYGGHWVAAGSNEVFELARCPAVSNDHDVNNERRGYKGISIPTASRDQRVRGRHPGDGRARTPHLPQRAQPLPVARRGQALGAVHRRRDARLPRREDRGRPHRLRRRSGQRRAGRADAGDAGHPAEELANVQRADARGGVHARALAGHPAGHRDAPRRWGSTWSTT